MTDKKLTLGSLFSGSGGFELAGLQCGIEPIWASEIEPFAIAVTKKHFPSLLHLGDINKIHGGAIPSVDIITGGFPCQNLSISGGRAGLRGDRSILFFQMIRIVREMLEATSGEYPKYLIFENVEGLLSSSKGADFATVMDEIADLGFISDPNTLNAADHGVAQRRRRVYIAAINRRFYDPAVFADAPKVRDKRMERAVAAWGGETFYGISSKPHVPVKQKLSEILQNNVDEKYFLSEKACTGILRRAGVRGKALPDILRIALETQAGLVPSCDVNEDTVSDVLGVFGENIPMAFNPGAASRLGGHCWEDEVGTLLAKPGDNQPAVVYDARGNGSGETVNTLVGDHANRVTDYTALAVTPVTMRLRSGKPGGGKGILCQDDKSATLACNNDQTLFVPEAGRHIGLEALPNVAAFMGGQGSGAGSIAYSEDVSPTLRAEAGGNSVPMVMTAFGISSFASNAMLSKNPKSGIYEAETARTLDTNGGRCDLNQGGMAIVAFSQNQREEVRDLGDCAGALAADAGVHQQTYIASDPTAYAMTTGCYTQVCEEQSPCLQARDWKDPNVVARRHYVVRRLTPQECALLQGFNMAWCEGLEMPEPTEADIEFWTEVWETHRQIMGTSKKPKTRKQIVKWMSNPTTDSNIYRLFGNGIALPCAVFVMQGVVDYDAAVR